MNYKCETPFENVNEKEEAINKVVDSRILFEMFRIFDFNARFFVSSFHSKILEIRVGDDNSIHLFVTINSRMRNALTVSVAYSEENMDQWNLKGQLNFTEKKTNGLIFLPI